MENNITTGVYGENRVCAYLEEEGYRILKRNFRCKCGEIDIIAEKRGKLCFIEVKSRKGIEYGLPCEAVGQEKRRKIINSAKYYLKCCPYFKNNILRFDVIELLLQGETAYIRHIEGAFGEGD